MTSIHSPTNWAMLEAINPLMTTVSRIIRALANSGIDAMPASFVFWSMLLIAIIIIALAIISIALFARTAENADTKTNSKQAHASTDVNANAEDDQSSE